jgi:hypothetical protein
LKKAWARSQANEFSNEARWADSFSNMLADEDMKVRSVAEHFY